jgi:hypothetical protein
VSCRRQNLRSLLRFTPALVVIGCATYGSPRPYRSPCASRPGFDQSVNASARHKQWRETPGWVHIPPPATSADVSDTLRAIATALRDAPDDEPTQLSVDIPPRFFEGLSCEQIFAEFENASFCATKPREARLPLFHLPPNWLGGGRVLIVHFDDKGYCDGAHYCGTQ